MKRPPLQRREDNGRPSGSNGRTGSGPSFILASPTPSEEEMDSFLKQQNGEPAVYKLSPNGPGSSQSMGMGRHRIPIEDGSDTTNANSPRTLQDMFPSEIATPAQDESPAEGNQHVKSAIRPLPITAKDVEGTPFLWVEHEFKNKKRNSLCCFYGIVVLCICILISFTIWLSVQLAHRHHMALLRREHALLKGDDNPFTFDDIFNSSLDYRSVSVDWIDGTDTYVYEEAGSLYSFDVAANATQLLVDKSIFDQLGATRYYVSNDLRYTLLAYEVDSLWRHSFMAKYKIYDRLGATRKARLIDFPNDATLRNTALQHAGWSPTGSALVFVSGNNVYYQPGPDDVTQQVTTSGQDKYLFNGVADWLYEEEILGTHVANWWAPDNRLVCYGFFNDTNVPLFKFPYYGPKTAMYGSMIEIAYPKAGDLTPGANTVVHLHIFNTSDPTAPHVMLQPPPELANIDHYFTKVSWRDSTTVTVIWSNRPQNRTITTICDAITGSCVENVERTAIGGWIDPDPPIRHIENGLAYLTILPRVVLSTGTWSHLAYITSPSGAEGVTTFLTDGQEEIKTLAAFEADRNLVYYISTNGDPRKRHLFRVGTPAADPAFQTPECMTCDLAPDYDYVSTSFSSTGRYYILSQRGPNIPRYYLKATQTALSDLLEDNADAAANLAEKTLPIKQYMQIPIGGGHTGWAELLIPPAALEPGNTDKFPLLVETYAGPGSQAVDLRFGTGFDTYMASTNKAVYVRLDGRGTTSRGNTFKHLVYRNLGTMEIDDQIAGAKYLRDNLGYIDTSKRPGIWGWSYGGFATAHAVANIDNFYGCGMIGAALSDRRYYDTAHTERFMGYATPEDNAAGYDGTDVMRKVALFTNKTILVVHGTADDNVHFASSMQLIQALTDAEIQFRTQVYPDQNHYFSSSSRHLYRLYSNFWLNDCWSVSPIAKVEYEIINISEQFKLT